MWIDLCHGIMNEMLSFSDIYTSLLQQVVIQYYYYETNDQNVSAKNKTQTPLIN